MIDITFISLAINIVVFLLLFNWSYLQKKRLNPAYPNKPVAQSILFPVGLSVAYTLLVDAYKGIFYYQMVLFLVVA
ncbi:MAG: hypothetical protein NTV45_07460, partial [Firmicutes bacterium]|nr:hypothetical protein [Bacillota bacterium]